jgi:hypothetical protein
MCAGFQSVLHGCGEGKAVCCFHRPPTNYSVGERARQEVPTLGQRDCAFQAPAFCRCSSAVLVLVLVLLRIVVYTHFIVIALVLVVVQVSCSFCSL